MVLGKLEDVVSRYGYHMARCPAHDDNQASLSVGKGTTQPVVLKCHANCATEDILAAIGLSPADICQPREQNQPRDTGIWTPRGTALARYPYTDEDGVILYEVLRAPNKQFPVRVPDKTRKSGWRWSMGDTRRVLYRLPALRPAIEEGRTIYITEGEKDVESVERTGNTATCNPGGAGNGKWHPEYSECLRDAVVVIIADADKTGREHARQIAASLEGIAASAEIREAAVGKDVTDHLAAGLTLDNLVVTRETSSLVVTELSMDLLDFVAQPDPAYNWALPNLMEREDKLIWTGWEGLGKTTVTRQVGVAAAAGVNPFNPQEHFDPKMVLFIDGENRVNRSRRKFRLLVNVCNAKFRQIDPGRFRIEHRPKGLNLLENEDRDFVMERVTAYKPDLIVIGPLYKLHNLDMNDERAAKSVISIMEDVVAVCGSALIMEAHAAHGLPRQLRPRGSATLMGWPDYGFGIKPKDPKDPNSRGRVIVEAWRGLRDETAWPQELIWGSQSEFPWVVPMNQLPHRGWAPGYGEAENWPDASYGEDAN